MGPEHADAREPQVLGQAAHLWTRTSLRPGDVDVAELYDGFTFNCLSWIEALGFCGPRQVPGARVAVVSSGGLTPSGVLLLRTDT